MRPVLPFVPPWRGLLKLCFLVGLILGANLLADSVLHALDFDLRPSNEERVHRMVMASTALYAGLMAVPFVPGVEIGLAMIAMLGVKIVPLVYCATLFGLSLSFLIGRFIPFSTLASGARLLRFHRVGALLDSIEPLPAEMKLAFLTERAPNRLIPLLLRHRYVALVVLFNVPGNFLIGGGGGIALVAGLSRLFSIPAFLATVALAVSPVPLLLLLLGPGIIG